MSKLPKMLLGHLVENSKLLPSDMVISHRKVKRKGKYMRYIYNFCLFTSLAASLTACNNGFDFGSKNSSSAVGGYAVTMNSQGGMTLSQGAANVASGSRYVTTVTPDAGFATSGLVGGSCPSGSWEGHTYTSGIITGPCSVIFSEVPAAALNFVPGSQAELDFSQIFNIGGIVPDNSMFSQSDVDGLGGGGFDGIGDAYSNSCVVDPVVLSSVAFKIQTGNVNNVFDSASGMTFDVPQASYQALQLVAAAVNGNQRAQKFIVQYTTGPAQIITQDISDWTSFNRNPGEAIARDCQYADVYDGSLQAGDHYLYVYQFNLDPTRVVVSIQTPANENIQILAMNLGAPF